MNETVILFLFAITTIHAASAMTWQSPSQDCTLTFPDADWTASKGRAVPQGQILVEALNHEQTKSATVLRFQAPSSASVEDPKFAENVKKGFAAAGSRPLGDGYTNLNGRTAYWLAGTKNVTGRQTATLSYALRGGDFLYQLHLESSDSNPAQDIVLLTIARSFLVTDKYTGITGSLAFRLGCIIGFLSVLSLGVRFILNRSQGHNRAPTMPPTLPVTRGGPPEGEG